MERGFRFEESDLIFDTEIHFTSLNSPFYDCLIQNTKNYKKIQYVRLIFLQQVIRNTATVVFCTKKIFTGDKPAF